MIERINGLLRQYTVESICAILAVGIIAFMLIDHVAGGGATTASAAALQPTSQATADAFPSPGKTVEVTHTVHLKDGSVATETVRSFTTVRANGKPLLVRQIVRRTARGTRVTRTARATTVVTLPGTNTITTETVTVPGPTVTIPGAETTVTVTATATKSVPGPTVTVTECPQGPC